MPNWFSLCLIVAPLLSVGCGSSKDTGTSLGTTTDTSTDTNSETSTTDTSTSYTDTSTQEPLDPNARTILPSDPSIHTVGRLDQSDPSRLPLHWPGSSVSFSFQAPSVSVTIDDAGDNYLNVYIDDLAPVVLDLEPGEHTYVLSEGLTAEPHRVAIHKRTETFEGDATVLSFELGPENRMGESEPDPTFRMEFYGDSITAGYSADCECDQGDAVYKNHDLTYAALAASALGGEHHTIALSGVGIVKSWWNAEMDDYWDGLYAGDGEWDFSSWPADVVVVNLGQNDYWLGVRGEIVRAYVEFLVELRDVHPNAEIFLALGSMDATAEGSPMPGWVEQAVTIRNESGDSDVHSLIFPYNGWGGHPIEADHSEMADMLIEAVLREMPELRGG